MPRAPFNVIKVRFFASLRERLGVGERDLAAASGITTVGDVWKAAAPGEAMASNTLCALNQEYVDADALVRDGDEVAFFPPVTGG